MITPDGLEIVKYFEGCRLTSYQDTAGIWTIGYGHTKNVQPNQAISQAEADQLLKADLLIAEKRVKKVLKEHFNMLSGYQLDALISQAFNLRSFDVLSSYIPERGIDVYLRKTLLYCKDVQGHELLGLKKRRVTEVLRFLGQSWEQIKVFV